MKFRRPTAVIASSVILAAGVAVAVDAAIPADPVKLCSSNRTGAVTVPDPGGACVKGSTEFFVADDSEVQALAGRVDVAEGTLSSHGTRVGDLEASTTTQAGRISALESQVSALEQSVDALKPAELTMDARADNQGTSFDTHVTGARLKPGSLVYFHTIGTHGNAVSFSIAGVDGDGKVDVRWRSRCTEVHVYTTGTAADGNPVTSNVIEKGPYCW